MFAMRCRRPHTASLFGPSVRRRQFCLPTGASSRVMSSSAAQGRDVGGRDGESSPHTNVLPRRRQLLAGLPFNWRAQAFRQGSVLNDISSALPSRHRTDEERRRVAGWEPVVQLLPDQKLRVALAGRANSGKSSLFNLLRDEPTVPHKKNVVKNFEGITRDAVEGNALLAGMSFTVIDTPGVRDASVVEDAFRTVETSDAVIVVAAADTDISDEERQLAAFLEHKRIPSFLILNKTDLIPQDHVNAVLQEWSALGVGHPLPLSTRYKKGLDLLAAALEPLYHIHRAVQEERDWDLEDAAMQGDESSMEEIRNRNCMDRFIRIAVVGRTNAGKSSLINRLVGFERCRAEEEKNTTRDPVEISCVYKGRKIQLIDTAGLTRERFRSDREFLGRLHALSINEIRFAHVVIVVFDATEGHPNKYDMAMLHAVAAEGRPFLLCGNKWDAVLDQNATAEAIDFKIKRQVREVKYTTAVVVSAATGLNLTLLMDQAIHLYDTWNKRVRRSELTKFWRKMEKSVIIPHHVARIGRITQVSARPPTLLLQLQTKKETNLLPRALQEMVKNAVVEEFGFQGVPLRLIQQVKDSNPDYI